MENISEAQHDHSNISATISSHNVHHSTSVSQEPIFNAQNEHNNEDEDVSGGCHLFVEFITKIEILLF